MGIQVIRLGAWCDFVGEDLSDDDVGGVADQADHLSFRVAEFAVLADGRRVTLHDDRGFDSLVHEPGPRMPGGPWRHLTLEQLEMSVRTTVLPDDAQDSCEEHPWEWLAGLLRAQGVEVAAEELRLLPYEVVFSERLRARVSGA
jgi:hypothetical protein